MADTRFATREEYERFKAAAGPAVPRTPADEPGRADGGRAWGRPPGPQGPSRGGRSGDAFGDVVMRMAQGGRSGGTFGDFVMFRRLITPGLVACVAFTSMVLAVGAGLILGVKGEYLSASLCLVGAFGIRLVGESIVVVFSAVELLREIRDAQRALAERS
jgi:hypothetical protein